MDILATVFEKPADFCDEGDAYGLWSASDLVFWVQDLLNGNDSCPSGIQLDRRVPFQGRILDPKSRTAWKVSDADKLLSKSMV